MEPSALLQQPADRGGWRDEELLTQAEPRLREWLSERGSLTRRLRAECHEPFRLEVIGQRDIIESTQARAFLREVLLSCGSQPWVYAQTLVPAPTLARHPWLRDLDAQPLGEALFARGDVARSALEFCRLGRGDPLHSAVVAATGITQPDRLWARRSRFHIGDTLLVVSEVFLAELQRCAAS